MFELTTEEIKKAAEGEKRLKKKKPKVPKAISS
jgi:hypothetical protein